VRRTIIARTAHEIARLRYFWDKLPAQTMFQSFAWNSTAARVFSEREPAHIIYSESDSGAVLIPLARRDRQLTLIGETLFDYRDVLATGDEEVLQAAWFRAAQLELDFSSGAVRSDGNLEHWQDFHLGSFYGAPKVSSQAVSADAFAKDHDRLGRYFRRFQRNGVELRCSTGSASHLIGFIYQRKGSQPAETGDSLFRDPLRQRFMIEICCAVDKACEVFTLESAGTMIAALVTFRDRNVRRFYTIYFDQAWSKQSPGMVLVYEVTRRSLLAGLDCDYMTGEHNYKTRLATSVVPMHWVTASSNALASVGRERQLAAA
jgi:CelD/BcsL family acetyltransferase involved in cellulose biosynthesis